MKLCGVYILSSSDGEKIYIGSSQDMNKRIKRHFRDLKTNQHHNENLQKLWNIENDIQIKKFLMDNRNDAYELERDLIKYHLKTDKLLNIGKDVIGGDNLTLHPRREEIIKQITESLNNKIKTMSSDERKTIWGRQGEKNPMYGKTHTEEVKRKLSEINKGITRRKGFKLSDEQKNKLSELASKRVGNLNHFFNKRHTDETKLKLREANLGKLPVNTLKVSIDNVIYTSFTEASRKLSIPVPTISWRVKSKSPKFNKYFVVM